MSTVGGRIKYARLARGLTQDQLAEQIGVTKGAVSQWESNTIEYLSAENLLNLSDVVEASARWLWLGKEKDGRDIPMGKPTHVSPDESALLSSYRHLQPAAQDELRAEADKYLRLAPAQKPSRANPYPRQKVVR